MEEEKQLIYRIPYHLQYFAGGDGADKTEEPTTKKLEEARKEGQVARSKELINASGLITLFITLKIFIGFIGSNFINTFQNSYQHINGITKEEFNVVSIQELWIESLLTILWTCLPLFAAATLISFVVVVYQVKWKVSGQLLKPKLSRLNPINGFKRIFSREKIVELILDIIKIFIVAWIAYSTLKDEWSTLLLLYEVNLEQAVLLIGDIIINLGIKISFLFFTIGLFDLFYQKLKFKKDMRMTKQEVKDEFKNTEGDPQVKSRIRSKMREVSRRRMMQAIPQADVVITNPTHLAAAIKYDRESSEAPVLVAKGADYLAQKIKEIAKENNVEIVENKPLARMLYYNVEVGAEIPPELYQMTAEVLAYVYGLKNKL
ncbi:MAG TPA: flagellar biosynthesis protein FlhB [Clostridiales bacterium]|nr:flagellar biosynthesis protein FlhB [Clostridiales bacterium]